VRGLGLMIGVELVKDKKTKEKAPEWRQTVLEKAFHKGLLLLGCGENTVRFMPPLIVTQEQAQVAVEILDETLDEIER